MILKLRNGLALILMCGSLSAMEEGGAESSPAAAPMSSSGIPAAVEFLGNWTKTFEFCAHASITHTPTHVILTQSCPEHGKHDEEFSEGLMLQANPAIDVVSVFQVNTTEEAFSLVFENFKKLSQVTVISTDE